MADRVYPENGKAVRYTKFARTAWLLLLPLLLPTPPAAAQAPASTSSEVEAASSTAAGVPATTRAWIFPDRSLLPDRVAGPRDPVTLGRLVYADPDPTAYGPGPAGEVAISETVPMLLLAGRNRSDALVLGMEGAAFARFSFAVSTRELVNTDWVFAVPLVWHRGEHWLRLRYYHTSSHLGDEYQRRFGPSSINFSRDGADFTAYIRPGLKPLKRIGLGVYGGGLLSLNSHPEEGAVWRVRGGAEVDPGGRRPWHPYVAVDFEREAGQHRIGWRTTVHAGYWLLPVGSRPLRLVLEWTAGPSPMGQFNRRETNQVAVGFLWNP